MSGQCPIVSPSTLLRGPSWSLLGESRDDRIYSDCGGILLDSVCDFSSKVEMGKWIEDLNFAIDMARKSQEKSSLFPDAALGNHSNRELLGGGLTWYFVAKEMATNLISHS